MIGAAQTSQMRSVVGMEWPVGRPVAGRRSSQTPYPTDAQAAELSRTFGCVRKVYNLALQARTEAWMLRSERVNYNAISAMLKEDGLTLRQRRPQPHVRPGQHYEPSATEAEVGLGTARVEMAMCLSAQAC
jgi:hypothetical protein